MLVPITHKLLHDTGTLRSYAPKSQPIPTNFVKRYLGGMVKIGDEDLLLVAALAPFPFLSP